MIARSTVSFSDLRRLLRELGFEQSKRGKLWFFTHAASETVLGYRAYRLREKVTARDLNLTRKLLEWRGLLNKEAFDDLLKKGTGLISGERVLPSRWNKSPAILAGLFRCLPYPSHSHLAVAFRSASAIMD